MDEKAQVCGWLKYKFGVTWQIAQVVLAEMSAGPDTKKSDAVIEGDASDEKAGYRSTEKSIG